MTNIFKIYNNFENNFDIIFIFCKTFLLENNMSLDEIIDKFTTNSNDEFFKKIFDESDYKIINTKPNVLFIDENIYLDDSIEDIKLKLLNNLVDITFEELYFYGIVSKNIDINLLIIIIS